MFNIINILKYMKNPRIYKYIVCFYCFFALFDTWAWADDRNVNNSNNSINFLQEKWQNLEQGLDFAKFSLGDGSNVNIRILRFDPKLFDFVVYSISQDKSNPKILNQWAKEKKLLSAINASMYLKDGMTSTGLLRTKEHVNNKRIVKNFGAFFVTDPINYNQNTPKLPFTSVLDRDNKNWQEQLNNYNTAVQNYRIISSSRQIVWKSQGTSHAISSVAQDGKGRILFIHCRKPIEIITFAKKLLQLPLDIRTTMYVEGGSDAGLLIDVPALQKTWYGQHPTNFLMADTLQNPLPNIIGVKRK